MEGRESLAPEARRRVKAPEGTEGGPTVGGVVAVAGVVAVSKTQFSGDSRLSKTNRAVHDGAEVGPTAEVAKRQPLTERDGVSLRVEAIDEDGTGLQPSTWRDTTISWRKWYKDTEDVEAVFENGDGDRVKGSDPSRFHPDYADKQYAKLKDLERGIREEYGKRLHTAMLTLTASSTGGEDGEALPPVDHLDELLSSWEAVRRALSRSLEGRRWEYLAILEPHKTGYVHVHIAVMVDGVVQREDFAPVIEAHLRNCDLASREAHDTTEDTTISVRHAGADREDDDALDELAIYLTAYLSPYDEDGEKQDPLEAPDHVQYANALLWATGRQRWRPSNGAQEYMVADATESDGEWRLVGVEDGEGELHEAGDGFGGVTKVDTFTPEDRWAGGDLRATGPGGPGPPDW